MTQESLPATLITAKHCHIGQGEPVRGAWKVLTSVPICELSGPRRAPLAPLRDAPSGHCAERGQTWREVLGWGLGGSGVCARSSRVVLRVEFEPRTVAPSVGPCEGEGPHGLFGAQRAPHKALVSEQGKNGRVEEERSPHNIFGDPRRICGDLPPPPAPLTTLRTSM